MNIERPTSCIGHRRTSAFDVYLVLYILLLSASTGQTATIPTPVVFAVTTNTVVGQSVFVVGSLPALGEWDPTRAIKLVPDVCVGSTCHWSAVIGLPQGAAYAYQLIRRNDCVSCYGDPGNVDWEPGPDRLGVAPVGPPAPFTGKTVFYYSGWPAVSIIYSNTATGSFAGLPMLLAGPGRTPGESLWRVDNLNTAGDATLTFVLTDNAGNFDNPDGVPGVNYVTPLEASLVQDGQVFNYWPAAAVTGSQIVTFNLSSTNLADRIIRVYLPRGYNQHTNKYYPVLYMHDGHNLFQGMGDFGCWNADTNANKLIRFGQMRETILVGVEQNSDRLREYTPPECSPPLGGSALGGPYASLLIDELKPLIDATYRTLPDAENTGVLGSSMGGLISLWLGWAYSGTYHLIGAMSSSFQVCYPVLTPESPRPIRVYVDSGDTGDGLANTLAERDNLIHNGYGLKLDLDHMIGYGHNHNEYWWDQRLPGCLTFLLPTRDEPNAILDSVAYPPRITAIGVDGSSNLLAWTSYRGRWYAVEGITNASLSSDLVWTNVFATDAPESNSWDYPSAAISNQWRFLRVRQHAEAPGNE